MNEQAAQKIYRDGKRQLTDWRRALEGTGCSSYAEYLKSDHWAEFKAFFLSRKEHQQCAVCDATPVDVHHRTYRHLGREVFGDVVSLCREHHTKLHERFKHSRFGMKRLTRSILSQRRYIMAARRKQSHTERVDVNEISSVGQPADSNGLENKTQRSGPAPAADVRFVTAGSPPDSRRASAPPTVTRATSGPSVGKPIEANARLDRCRHLTVASQQ